MSSAFETISTTSSRFPSFARSSSHPDEDEPGVHYRRQVEMSGWVMKNKHRFRGKQIRRYFRLKSSILTNHPKKESQATWKVSVSKCVVKMDKQARFLHLRTVDRQVKFTCDTEKETVEWHDALKAASVCNISDFYEIGRQLGVGSFGTVKLGCDVHSKQKRAIKIINKTATNTKEDEFQQREIDVILAVRHENIVRTFDVFDEEKQIHVVMEYLSQGDMFDYLARRKYLPEYEAKNFMHQLLTAVQYLHGRNIVHRDIKAENCLLASQEPLKVKLADFGFSRFINAANDTSPRSVALKSVVGTCYYIAPEILDGVGHSFPVDVFSSGVLMYRVLNGRLPFRGHTQEQCFKLAKENKANFNSTLWKSVSPEGLALCKSMLQADPTLRPTAEEALAHPWFTEDEDFIAARQMSREIFDRNRSLQSGSSLRSSSMSTSLARAMTYDDIPEPVSNPFA